MKLAKVQSPVELKFLTERARVLSGFSPSDMNDLLRKREKGPHFTPEFPSSGQGVPNYFSFGDIVCLRAVKLIQNMEIGRPWMQEVVEAMRALSRIQKPPQRDPLSPEFFEDRDIPAIHEKAPQYLIEVAVIQKYVALRYRIVFPKGGKDLSGEERAHEIFDPETHKKVSHPTVEHGFSDLDQAIRFSPLKITVNLNYLNHHLKRQLQKEGDL